LRRHLLRRQDADFGFRVRLVLGLLDVRPFVTADLADEALSAASDRHSGHSFALTLSTLTLPSSPLPPPFFGMTDTASTGP
jgi:hypothetical protein